MGTEERMRTFQSTASFSLAASDFLSSVSASDGALPSLDSDGAVAAFSPSFGASELSFGVVPSLYHLDAAIGDVRIVMGSEVWKGTWSGDRFTATRKLVRAALAGVVSTCRNIVSGQSIPTEGYILLLVACSVVLVEFLPGPMRRPGSVQRRSRPRHRTNGRTIVDPSLSITLWGPLEVVIG